MAHKLPWGSNFSIKDLSVEPKDDPFINFPFLELNDSVGINGMQMTTVNELSTGNNTVRGTQALIQQKSVGLAGSLSAGWDRTSWPIPFMPIDGRKEAFDRRHTMNVCRNIKPTLSVPSAEYRRVFPDNGGIINSFLDHSILTLGAMWGNVFGPIPEDTKDHWFITAAYSILDVERKRNVHDQEICTRPIVRQLLHHMGCYTRYNFNKTVIERIVTGALDRLTDKTISAPVHTINPSEQEKDNYVQTSEDQQPTNTEDDNYYYYHIPIRNHSGFCYTYADRLLRVVCERENAFDNRNGLEETLDEKQKRVKVLLHNENNGTDSIAVAKSRNLFKKGLNDTWQTRRDNVLNPVKSLFNFDITTKKLSDLNMEIWYMHQLEGEDEPIEMAFDDEETIL